MKKIKLIILAILFLGFSQENYAQFTFFNPEGAFTIEVSLENTDLLRLPIYRNATTSLAVIGDNIIGGTTAKKGLTPFIYIASIKKEKLTNIYELDGFIKNQQGITTGFKKGENNILYAGTKANTGFGGGHLMQIEFNKKGLYQVVDLGIPVANEDVLSLINNKDNTKLYGIATPSGAFFSFDIASGKTTIYKDLELSDLNKMLIGHYNLSPEEYLSNALVEADNGLIYGSAPENKLFSFDPASEKITVFEDHLPKVWGRKPLGNVESWLKTEDGKIYGGNAGDGQLFLLDTKTNKIKNFGKPIMMNHLKGMTFGADGKLYGIAGGSPGYSHLFSYDDENGFVDMGNPQFKLPSVVNGQDLWWRGFQLSTIVSSEDGKYIIMGENESFSQLFVFPVSKK